MVIRICSYLSASFLLENEPQFWDVVVVLDSDRTLNDFVGFNSKSSLAVRFDDVVATRSNKILPTRESVSKVLAFAKGKENLLICCRAGQSRSSALAFLVACQELGDSSATSLLNPARHVPNELVLTIGGALLQSSVALDEYYRWRREHYAINLSDHHNEIEREIEQLEKRGAINKICS